MPITYGARYVHNHQNLTAEIKRGLQGNLKAAAIIWHAGVIKALRGGRSGRTYIVPGTGGTKKENVTVNVKAPRYKISSYTRGQKKRYGVKHQASAPGEAPATMLGDLRTSYKFIVKDDYAMVGSPLKYALALEKGTSTMAPRPLLKPALIDNRARVRKALERAVL